MLFPGIFNFTVRILYFTLYSPSFQSDFTPSVYPGLNTDFRHHLIIRSLFLRMRQSNWVNRFQWKCENVILCRIWILAQPRTINQKWNHLKHSTQKRILDTVFFKTEKKVILREVGQQIMLTWFLLMTNVWWLIFIVQFKIRSVLLCACQRILFAFVQN